MISFALHILSMRFLHTLKNPFVKYPANPSLQGRCDIIRIRKGNTRKSEENIVSTVDLGNATCLL